MPMVRAMRLLNSIEAGVLTSAQLETLLADAGRLAEFKSLMQMRGQVRRIAASSTALAVVMGSPSAFAAVVSSSAAAMAVVAVPTALTALLSNATAWATFLASSTAMTALAANLIAMTTVAANLTVMTALAANKTGLLACWNSETALSALRSSSTALTALLASPYASSISGNPSSLSSTMVAGKTILLKSNNSSANDTNYLRTRYTNGSIANGGDYTYSTSPNYTTQMLAFQDIKHYSYAGNQYWSAYLVKVD